MPLCLGYLLVNYFSVWMYSILCNSPSSKKLLAVSWHPVHTSDVFFQLGVYTHKIYVDALVFLREKVICEDF